MRFWPRTLPRPLQILIVSTLLAALGGCAAWRYAPASAEDAPHWQGRLAVKVYSNPVQAFSASFELQGTPQGGQLVLSTVLGSTLAQIEWHDGLATLRTSDDQRAFDSLETLARRITGADVPVADLFSWLQGHQTNNPRWLADLSELENGRISAHTDGSRSGSGGGGQSGAGSGIDNVSANPADLKIILDR